MYIEFVPNRDSPPAMLLRESYREDGKVRKRTLANLSCLSTEVIEGLKTQLRGGVAVPSAAEVFSVERSLPHGHVAAVLAIQEIVERELAAPPALAELAAQAAMSERTLTRRFAAATGSNLRRYVAALRLELAAFLLRTGRQSLDHIADECGFGSVSALSHAFAAGHGCSPLRYRAQQRGRND